MIHLQRKIIKTMKQLILKVYMLVYLCTYLFIYTYLYIYLHIYIFVYIYTHAHARTHIRTDSLSLSLSDPQNPCNKRHKDITQYIRKPYQKIWCTIFHSRAEVCMDTHGSFFFLSQNIDGTIYPKLTTKFFYCWVGGIWGEKIYSLGVFHFSFYLPFLNEIWYMSFAFFFFFLDF